VKVGLRIDVDTFRGTRDGVPNLCKLLEKHSTKASFFFSVGPDNMGRNLWRLLHPSFLRKMLRTKAASLYGWDILLRGTFWPGPLIGEKLAGTIKAAAGAGHEIGLHAWDHYRWQVGIDRMGREGIRRDLEKGCELLSRILGHPPLCSAVPAWKCNDTVLVEKSKFAFRYNSDCRGNNVFLPLVDGKPLSQPQIPVTLPTYDEVIGTKAISPQNYNEYILSLLRPNQLNVLTIHAEVEGIICLRLFDCFLEMAKAQEVLFVPLGELLAEYRSFEPAAITSGEIPGREGWLSFQTQV
jgi:undecaprenyl phosphate-alpha-L-ara4FN deformylase